MFQELLPFVSRYLAWMSVGFLKAAMACLEYTNTPFCDDAELYTITAAAVSNTKGAARRSALATKASSDGIPAITITQRFARLTLTWVVLA